MMNGDGARLESFAGLRCVGVISERRPSEFSTVVVSAATETDRCLRAAGLKPHDDLIAYYRPIGAGRFQLSVGRPADQEAPAGLQRFDLPSGEAATAHHVGPYAQLGTAWDACFEWIDAHDGLKPTPGWEVYHHLEDPQRPSTTVQVLYRRKSASG